MFALLVRLNQFVVFNNENNRSGKLLYTKKIGYCDDEDEDECCSSLLTCITFLAVFCSADEYGF